MVLPDPVGFVLSGGAALGAVQVGMLRALAEHDVEPGLVVGSSVGALNSAVVASDPRTAHVRLGAIWSTIRRGDVFPGSLLTQARTLVRSRRYLFEPSGLSRVIGMSVSERRIEDLRLPLGAVVTDARTGHAVTLTNGPLEDALLASAAIPGLFPAVTIDGTTYVDGGVAANVPVLAALEMGASSLVVLDAGYPCHRRVPPSGITESLLFSSSILLRHQVLAELPYVARRVPVVYLPSPCPQTTSPLDFTRSANLIADGYAQASSFLESVRVAGPGLYGIPHAHDDALLEELAAKTAAAHTDRGDVRLRPV